MTAPEMDLVTEIIPLMKRLADQPGVWMTFTTDRGDAFARSARYVILNRAALGLPDTFDQYHGNSAVVEWRNTDNTWTRSRNGTLATTPDRHDIGRIRLRTPRKDTP